MDQTSSPAYPAFAKPALSSKAASLLADAAYFLFPQSIIELEPSLVLAFVDSKPAQDRLKPRHGGRRTEGIAFPSIIQSRHIR
jgi:hypothetical protein